MIFYNFIFILILILLLITNKKSEKKVYSFIVFIFFILSFIRWEVGTDWNNYYSTFYAGSIEKMYLVSELGFKFLNYVIYKISSNYTIMLFVFAFILFSFKYTILYKFSYCPLLSVLMAYSLDKGDIFFVRQNIAIAITFYSIKYIVKRKKLKFIVFIILASFIHRSSIIFIFSYFIYNKFDLKRRYYFLLILFAFIFSNYIEEILKFFIEVLPNSSYKNRLIYYLFNSATGDYKSYMSKNLIFLSSVMNRFFLISVFFIFWKKIDNHMKKLFSIYFVSFLGYICIYQTSPDIGRLILPYEAFQLIIFPSIYKCIKDKKIKIIFILIAILYLYLKLLSGLSSRPDEFIPYKSIFNQ